MIWQIKKKEEKIKTCFALFPKKIGDYRLWLSRYYKTWDLVRSGGLYGNSYIAHWFIFKEDAIKHVKSKSL